MVANFRTRIVRSRQTIRAIIALFSSNIVSTVLSAIGGLLVARFLGPEETGPFRAFTIPLTYLMFLHLGINDALWLKIPYYVGKNMSERVDAIASAAGAFMFFLSGVVSFGFLCCATYSLLEQNFLGFFGWLSQAFFSWEVFYGSYLISTYRTLNHFVTIARIQMVQAITTFGMVFLLPFLRFYGLCARVALPSLLVDWLYHQNRPLKVSYRFDTNALKELIKIGFPFSVWGGIYTSAWTATESALILSLAGVPELGLFSVAYAMRSGLNTLPMAMWQVIEPRAVTNLAKDGSVHNANERIVWVTVGLTSFMVLVASVTSMVLADLVPILIPKYTAGIPVMKVALWFPVVQAAFLPINTLFATGRPWLFGRSVITGVLVFALSTYLLLPEFGGLLSVVMGSLFGRAARTLAAYFDLYLLTKREAMGSGIDQT